MTPLVLRDVEVAGTRTDVVVADGLIRSVEADTPAPPGATVVEGEGGALLPGLWDHHLHLLALAATARSVAAGPPDVTDRAGLAAALADAVRHRPGEWVRAVGYHESVAGELDRDALDALCPDAPVRVQHRSGALWVLNSEAIRRLDLEDEHRPGVERDAAGRVTGRLYGLDRWLRDRLGPTGEDPPPDLAAVGRRLARHGVVGVTDATPYERSGDLDLLAGAVASGALPQRVVVTGGPALAGHPAPPGLARGPVKLRLADHALPSLDELVGWVQVAHAAERPVAVHCVTREALVLTLAALDEAGSRPGDRIEHGAVVLPDLHEPLRRHRLTVVTQPGFVAERGDRYLVEVDPDDRPHLYPCGGLLRAGVAVAGSTDAPFGDPDPWRAIAAAATRRTAAGATVGAEEAVGPARALDLFLGAPDDPGGPPRRVEPGAAADLVLLGNPRAAVLEDPAAAVVRATIVDGRLVHGA